MSTLKPVLVAGAIVALDKYALNQTNLNNSLYFGLAGAIGVYTASMVTPLILRQGGGSFMDARTLEGRILEVGLGTGSTYALYKFVFNNDLNPNDLMIKCAVVAGADLIAEYIDDYLSGRPLAFLK